MLRGRLRDRPPWHSRPMPRVQRIMNRYARAASGPDSAARYLPADEAPLPLEQLRERARGCQACPLYKLGTQTVFGEGPPHAAIVMIGEQPGDQEDRQGRPFVGPAGRLLDRALEAAGIDRSQVYLTNTVKHFKWEPAGKRRLHKKPSSREIAACRPWLEAELAAVQPEVVVALGATAAQTLMGADFLVTKQRGLAIEHVPWARHFVATVHPSSILRGEPDERERAFDRFTDDLKRVAALLHAEHAER